MRALQHCGFFLVIVNIVSFRFANLDFFVCLFFGLVKDTDEMRFGRINHTMAQGIRRTYLGFYYISGRHQSRVVSWWQFFSIFLSVSLTHRKLMTRRCMSNFGKRRSSLTRIEERGKSIRVKTTVLAGREAPLVNQAHFHRECLRPAENTDIYTAFHNSISITVMKLQ